MSSYIVLLKIVKPFLDNCKKDTHETYKKQIQTLKWETCLTNMNSTDLIQGFYEIFQVMKYFRIQPLLILFSYLVPFTTI